MRSINLTNSKKRDARVSFESAYSPKSVRYVMKNGSERRSLKVLKSTLEVSEDALAEKCNGDYKALGEALISGDPEVDFERIGRIISRSHKLYLNENNEVVYHVNLFQVRKDPGGSEVSRVVLEKTTSNINLEIPVQWTGKKFPKKDAVRKFVFSRTYQIKHISGLTFDFLYEMAKELAETGTLMLMGAGTKGGDPLILTTGGEPYRAFLEGRVEGGKYCLLLHLTNMELKKVPYAS
jgi:hypothetical protein